MTSSAGEEVILASVTDGIGEIVLNRPAALNALNLPMIRRMLALYAEWSRPGSGVRCILVRGAGGKAFCAGGDVKSNVLAARSGDTQSALEFFREEYTMDAAIGRLAVPHVAVLDGIVMGGGAGASMHGHFRIATERTLFAMPETSIGLFPDVGMMQLLATLPGEVGTWLALTGARLKGHALKEVGLATHYLPSAAVPGALAAIRTLGPAAASAAPSDAARRRPLIDAFFAGAGGGSGGNGGGGGGRCGVARVFDALRGARLEGADEEWRKETLQQLERASPLSAAVTWEYMRRARQSKMTLPDCLEQDWALVTQFVPDGADYWEGVRARLIDKDERPRWKVGRVEDVPAARVDALMRLAPGQRRLGLAGARGGGGGESRL